MASKEENIRRARALLMGTVSKLSGSTAAGEKADEIVGEGLDTAKQMAEGGPGADGVYTVTFPDGSTKDFTDPVEADKARRQARKDAGLGPQTAADGLLDMVDQANADAAQTVADAKAAAAPPDTFAAIERELARARTQIMMRETNGMAGSASGAGLGQIEGRGIGLNRRITVARDDRFLRAQMNPNANQNKQRAMSVFNFPLLGAAKRGAFR